MIEGLEAGKVLTQNQDCSSISEITDVELLDPEKYEVSDWALGRCRSCGFSEYQRTARKKPENDT